jgi:type II secretory pathway pseudopilin PulG
VIAIIVILISLLIPTVHHIYQAAYAAETRNEISEIASACQRYYDDWRAYPGPVSNSDIDDIFSSPAQPDINDGISSPPGIYQTANSNTFVTSGGKYFTSSENLVLGLLGGLWIDPGSTDPEYGKLAFVNGASGSTDIPSTLIGTGPQTLVLAASGGNVNPAYKQYQSYLSANFPGSSLLLNGDGSSETGLAPYHDEAGRTFNDCVVPVFTDAYPDHMPILYMRARVGAPGVISGPPTQGNTTDITDPTTGAAAYYNYDLREILPYTGVKAGVLSNSNAIQNPTNPTEYTGQHGLQGVADTPPATALNTTVNNALLYFTNSSIAPTTTQTTSDDLNRYGTPWEKDGFILISAGPDRTYGTGDDITNFGTP